MMLASIVVEGVFFWGLLIFVAGLIAAAIAIMNIIASVF
jgi:hypothetical protein